MNLLSIFLLAFTFVSVHSSAVEGHDIELVDQELDGNSLRRQLLLQDTTCTLYRKCETYRTFHKNKWSCKVSETNTRKIGTDYIDIDIDTSPELKAQLDEEAVSGTSTLTFSKGFVNTRLRIPKDAKIKLIRSGKSSQKSEGPPNTGTLKVLMIRLIDENYTEPTSTAVDMHAKVFGTDGTTFKTQMHACSDGKLIIEPFEGNLIDPDTDKAVNVEQGIVDVQVNGSSVGAQDFPTKARNAVKDQLGDLVENDEVGLVLFCFPPGLPKNKGLAWAYTRHKFTFYNDKWCTSNGAIMHEVGHNFDLGHSGKDGDTYGDAVGLMGSNVGVEPRKMCYNAQKSYQLKWYQDKVEDFNPIGQRQIFRLTGIDKYNKAGKDDIVVLRLKQESIRTDFYVGFNLATGINEDTLGAKNRITVTHKLKPDPFVYSQSNQVAALFPGGNHTLTNFDGQNKDIMIRFVGRDGGKATIEVVDLNNQYVIPKPKHCNNITIELTTDSHPDRNAWYILNKAHIGNAIALSPPYNEKKTFHSHTVCLPVGFAEREYEITLVDEKQRNHMSYKIYNTSDDSLFYASTDKEFEVRSYDIKVPPYPTLECDDDETFFYKGEMERNCSWFKTREKKYCKRQTLKEYCPKTCGECPVDPADCKDDETFLMNDMPNKDCSWVKAKPSRTRPKFCKNRKHQQDGVNKFVQDWCPEACDKCPQVPQVQGLMSTQHPVPTRKPTRKPS